MEGSLGSLLIAARAVHFASAASLAGALNFFLFAALPSLAETGAGASPAARNLKTGLTRIVWLSYAFALVSGAAWFMLFTIEMSGAPLDEALTAENFHLALWQTQLGAAWSARFVLALALGVVLALRRWAAFQALLATAILAGMAWSGHAGAGQGAAGAVHAASDVLHLIATGVWLGGLAPLVLLLSCGWRASAGDGWAAAAATATKRFSTLATLSVAALIGTGLVNGWFLIGSVPALFGTAYGRLMLLKIALLGAMLALAAVNRLSLTPALTPTPEGAAAAGRLMRNALLETGLGLAVLTIVATFGVMPPGAHEQPDWPLPVRVEMKGLSFPPDVKDLLVPAHPTSFQTSPHRYSAQTIAAGAALYAGRCAGCHGADGDGNGPDAKGLKKQPSDLTSHQAYARLPGDRFWDIAHIEDHSRQTFAETLDAPARWRLVDYLQALGDAAHLRMQEGAISATAFRTPNFSADCPGGENVALEELRGRLVRLVMVDGAAAGRFVEGEAAAPHSEATAIILPLGEAGVRWKVCATGDPKVAEAFAIYAGGRPLDGAEFLLDELGRLRFVWRPSAPGERLDPAALRRLLDEIRRTPGAPLGGGAHRH